MNKKEIEKVIADKLETFTLNKDTKEIWLIPYEDHGIDSIVDIAQNEKELKELVEYHEKEKDNYRIIKIFKVK